VGTPANFERLLDNDETILVFPEGSRGIAKTWRNRYRLQPFGNGFMRLAIKGRAPIVPIAVVGAEEQQPAFFNLQKLGKVLGAPAFPITPTFPWLGPLGLLPYPSKYDIYFGEPLLFDGLDNDDDAVIRQKVELVKDSIQTMIEAGRKRRKGFLG
jgi:1-acyl-sn-glycerol-3-phosphate acyltransferase